MSMPIFELDHYLIRRKVLKIFGSSFHFDVEVFVSPGGYILGEETALLECMEDRRGEPRNKPPYPGSAGLWGCPTLINNVETVAHATGTPQVTTQQHGEVSGPIAPGHHALTVTPTRLGLVGAIAVVFAERGVRGRIEQQIAEVDGAALGPELIEVHADHVCGLPGDIP